MTDRGDLEYKIRTKDEFSADLTRFQAELIASKKEFRAFKNELGKVGATSRSFAKNLGVLRKATRETTRDVLNRARATDRAADALQRQAAAEGTVASAIQAHGVRTGEIRTAEAERLATLRALNTTLRSTEASSRRAATGVRTLDAAQRRTVTSTRSLAQASGGLRGVVENVFFTFRRLVGVLAIFSVAREAATGFKNLVAESINFNSTLEQNTLGIAALITSVGDMRDRFGQTTDAATRLSLSQGEARRQLRLLQAEAQNTAATFEDLASAFQTSIGFGLDAGLDINQVRKFTVLISQAAATIGLEQNQLAEEIRSLLSGTINPRNTRIATVLGITNEDVRRAKEAGVLAEFLQSRFEAFNVAGKEAAKTFRGLATNTADAFRRLLAEANFGFFTEVKGLLSDTLNSLQGINEEGFLEVRPEVLDAFKGLGDSLAAIVASIRTAASELTFADVAPLVNALGKSLEGVGKVVIGIGQGFTLAFSVLTQIAQIVSAIVVGGTPLNKLFNNTALKDVAATLTLIATLFAGMEGTALLVGVAIRNWKVAAAAAGLTLIVTGLEKALNKATGVNTEFSKMNVFAAALAAGVTKLLLSLDFSNAIEGAKLFFSQVGELASIAGGQLQAALLKGLNAVGLILDEQLKLDLDKIARDGEKSANELIRLSKAQRALAQGDAARLKEVDDRIGAAIDSGKGLAGIFEIVSDVLGLSPPQITKATEAFEEQNGVLVRNVKRLQQQQELTERLTEGVRKANEELKSARSAAAANPESAAGAAATEIALKAQLQFQKEAEGFLKERLRIGHEIEALEKNLALIRADNADRERIGIKDRVSEERTLAQIVAKTQQLAGVNADLLAIETSINRERDLRLIAGAIAETQAQTKLVGEREAGELEARASALAQQGLGTQAALLQGQANLLRLQREKAVIEAESLTRLTQLAALEGRLQQQRQAALVATNFELASQLSLDIAEVQRGITAALEDRLIKETQITEEIRKQKTAIDESQLVISSPAAAGVQKLVKDWSDASLAAEAYAQVLSQTVASASAFISQTLVDALDPTTDTDILQRFSDFLKQLAQMILQTFIQLAIQKAIAGLFAQGASAAAGGGGGGVAAALGQAKGGKVPGGRFAASPAHFAPGVQHFARGGRPKGIPASDTVPAWLTPNEFVMRTSAVRRYGANVMAAINRGLIDPTALRSLAGAARPVQARSPSIPAFAEGGVVRSGGAGSSAVSPAPSLQRAVVVADETTFAQLLAQGRRPLVDLLRDEVPQIVSQARASGLLS